MKKYDKYKSSGIEWMGDIPKHWKLKRLANFGKFLKGGGFSKKDLVDNGKPAILYGDIYTRYNIEIKCINRFISKEKAKDTIKINKGDLLFTGSGETLEDIGKCVTYLSDNIVCAGGDVIIFRQSTENSLFLSYLLNTQGANFQKALIAKGQIIIHVYASGLRNIILALPTEEEQLQISNYLNKETSKIDEIIKDKEQLIKLLEEEKEITISNAVTKGLNLDVVMKDSAIEWIGNIPQDWEVKKIKYIFDFFDNKRIPLSGNERGVMKNKIFDYYGASGIIDKVSDYIFDGEYILIGEDGANLLDRNSDLAFKAIGKFWVNNHAHILKPKKGNIDFFVYYLENLDYTIWVSGSAQPKLTAEALKNISNYNSTNPYISK